jgi:hypothetical protein
MDDDFSSLFIMAVWEYPPLIGTSSTPTETTGFGNSKLSVNFLKLFWAKIL